MVQRMSAHHVSQLVRQESPKLIVIEQLDRRRVNHDERLVDAVCAGIEEWRLGDVDLRDRRPVERRHDFVVQVPEFGKLRRTEAHRVALKEQPNPALPTHEGEHLPDHFIDSGDPAQASAALRGRRGAPRRPPRSGGRSGEGAVRAVRWSWRTRGWGTVAPTHGSEAEFHVGTGTIIVWRPAPDRGPPAGRRHPPPRNSAARGYRSGP